MSGRKWHFYDESERRKWQNPEEILKELGLQPGQTIVDIGCGQGFFTLPAALLTGPQGLVYAIDSSSESIDVLSQKAAAAGLQNIRFMVQEAEVARVCEKCADLVFLGIVLHDFRDPAKVLRNAFSMLKADGRLANLDWKKEPSQMGPPLQKRFDTATAAGLITEAGLTIIQIRERGVYDYLITARR